MLADPLIDSSVSVWGPSENFTLFWRLAILVCLVSALARMFLTLSCDSLMNSIFFFRKASCKLREELPLGSRVNDYGLKLIHIIRTSNVEHKVNG